MFDFQMLIEFVPLAVLDSPMATDLVPEAVELNPIAMLVFHEDTFVDHNATALLLLAVFDSHAVNEVIPLATCVFADLDVCRSTALVPRLFPQVIWLLGMSKRNAPVHFGTIATSAFVLDAEADKAST